MPTSHYQKISTLVELIVLTDPKRLIDIGVGFGKYGVLAREYLELWESNASYGKWNRRIDGIEIFETYLSPLHDYVYDNVYVGDAAEVLKSSSETYDLALLIDVLEHCTYEHGAALLRRCQAVCRNLLICTPKNIGEQGDMFGNPNETHRFQWEKSHFEQSKNHFFVPDPASLICYVGEDASRVWSWRLRARLARAEHKSRES